MAQPALAIHGGAGVIDRTDAARMAAARVGLRAALDAGRAVLERGGAALHAVETAARALEDDPSFNAGRGAALNADGEVELDAAIMDGATGRAGALAAVRRVRNPVSGARAIMERSPHVMLVGEGAERFVLAQGVERAEPSWFITERARRDLDRFRVKSRSLPRGTIGAVAVDRDGRLAAATSTGGTTGKLPGRVGDCPIIGAGTWADELCAISATGHGEAFIRAAFAHSVARWIADGVDPRSAGRRGLDLVTSRGGDGGAIIATRAGQLVLVQHDDMFRARWDASGTAIAIFGDEG